MDYITGKIDMHKREIRVNLNQNVTSKKLPGVMALLSAMACIIVCIEVDEGGHRLRVRRTPDASGERGTPTTVPKP